METTSLESPGQEELCARKPESGRTVSCLCLQSFSEGERPYIHLTPPVVVDAEGRTEPTGLVCCNSCWLQMSLFQRAMISLLTTPAEKGGFMVGPLVHERFWPDILKPRPTSSAAAPLDSRYESGKPVGDKISKIIEKRNAGRR